MWIAEKASKREDYGGKCSVGRVSIGGLRPAVLSEGEIRNAELLSCGFVYVPEAGDEVLLVQDGDGEALVGGKIISELPEGISQGEVYIKNKAGAVIHIKNNGDICLSGNIFISGSTNISGALIINGGAYVAGGGASGA